MQTFFRSRQKISQHQTTANFATAAKSIPIHLEGVPFAGVAEIRFQFHSNPAQSSPIHPSPHPKPLPRGSKQSRYFHLGAKPSVYRQVATKQPVYRQVATLHFQVGRGSQVEVPSTWIRRVLPGGCVSTWQHLCGAVAVARGRGEKNPRRI